MAYPVVLPDRLSALFGRHE